jgi:chromosome segregation ATPase
MKKTIALWFGVLLLTGFIHAQTAETINNESVIKMAQARLTDDLIIEVINTSPVKFDLSENSLKTLSGENVSSAVIEAMKNAVTSPVPQVKSNVPPKTQAAPVKRNQAPATKTVEALAYINPAKELVKYYESEFKTLNEMISGWNKSIQNSFLEAEKLNGEILQTESELRMKKNADASGFSNDILALKKQLTTQRESYKTLKTKMLEEGVSIREKLGERSSNQAKSIGKKYDEVSQLVKSADADPTAGTKAAQITCIGLDINEDISIYIAPVTEMLYWFRNEVSEIQKMIGEWNPKVTEVVRKDEELAKKLQPLVKQQEEYKSDSKKYKTELAALKKQIDAIEKERKALTVNMEEDSRKLSDLLKARCAKLQDITEQRFTDIIANIAYTYQEKFQL